MTDRGTNNGPNTRNPERPHSHPSRLDQYGKALEEGEYHDKNVYTKKERKK